MHVIGPARLRPVQRIEICLVSAPLSVIYGATAPWYLDLVKNEVLRIVSCGELRIAGYIWEMWKHSLRAGLAWS
jgi:hypothetical protein